jgi:hypothetical protein
MRVLYRSGSKKRGGLLKVTPTPGTCRRVDPGRGCPGSIEDITLPSQS